MNERIRQFKEDADPETGVVAGERLQGAFQPIPSKPVLLWQAADGHIEPATGRHRIDLARRNGLTTIPANVIREADGWTPERTRLLDAMDNILDEKGSDQDFVAFFRGAGIDRETAERKGLLARKKGRDAFEIAMDGGEDIYSLVMGKDPWVTPEKAAAIVREAPRSLGAFAEDAQRAVAKAVRERNLTADGAAIMARGLMAARRERQAAIGFAQDDLFGADDTALAFAAEEASFADGERRKALRALQRVNAALEKGDALDLRDDFAKELGIKNAKSAEELRAAAERLRQVAERWENYHTVPELYQKAHAYAKDALGIPDVLVERADGSLMTDRELESEQTARANAREAGEPEALLSVGPLYTGAGMAYDKPSLLKIGSGEGAQVYGWGLYASDREGVARSYANDRRSEQRRFMNEGFGVTYEGRPIGELDKEQQWVLVELTTDFAYGRKAFSTEAVEAMRLKAVEIAKGDLSLYDRHLREYRGKLDEAQDILEHLQKGDGSSYNGLTLRDARHNVERWADAIEVTLDNIESTKRQADFLSSLDSEKVAYKRPKTLTPAIHRQTWWTHRPEGDESHLLKWNGPVSEENVQRVMLQLEREGNIERSESFDAEDYDYFLRKFSTSGELFYNQLMRIEEWTPQETSEFLYRAGIDGVKYPVRASTGGNGSAGWNYVAFSDEHLRMDGRKVWDGQEYVEDEGFEPEAGVLMSPAPEMEGQGSRMNARELEGAARAEMEALDAAANGPGFVPLERGENLNRLEKRLRDAKDIPMRNEHFGLTSSIATGGNISKLATVNQKGGENTEAHKYAMKNLSGLYERASVAVRHADKKLVGNKRSDGHYIRLFAPFRFNGQTYVALISQRESKVAPGVHAIEALEVVPTENTKAEVGLAFSSGHGRDLRPDGPASPIHSALTEEKIAYTLGDVNLTRPERLDGTPYPADALLEDVQDAVARFELRAAERAREASGNDETMGTDARMNARGLENAEADSASGARMIRDTRMFAGERILPAGAYPMEGRMEPLGGAPGSPASEFGRRTLGLSDLVMIYHELTHGDLPRVISNRARMGKAYGRYFVGRNQIELAAQIFGLLDESDVDALRSRLVRQGYFRHLDPNWVAARTAQARKLEKLRSEEHLEREVKRLARERVRKGRAGEREVKVMAHELWHMIDDQDGCTLERGNLVGHLAALKYYMKEAFPVKGFAGNRELKQEAERFIHWWRGVPDSKDVEYFMEDPGETLAEIGGAYFTAPRVLRDRAPKLYDALTFALAQHPKAQEAYDNAVAYIAGGEKAKRLAKMQGRTWTREAQSTMRALTRQATGTDNSPKRWLMWLNGYLWDRQGPAIMLYNEASRDSLRELRRELRAGRIKKADYEAAKARFDEGLAILKKRHLDYTRLGSGLSRLYLADVRGELEARLAQVDPNPDVARAVVDEYAFNKRVLELKGRAAAYGTTVEDARVILNGMVRERGLEGMRKVVTAWRTFRAIYEREVIENASVRRMLGPKAIDLMRANASYVTMRHTLTPEQAERLAERLMDKKGANGAALEIALERLLPHGGETGGSGAINQLRRLTGSLQATESPLLATMKTAVGLITAAERNAAVADLAKALADSGHVEAQIVPWSRAVRNNRHAPIEFWEGGEHKALMVPAIVAKGFEESDDQTLKVLTYATRFINATFTTNNPGFVPRAQIKDMGASSLNIPGLWRTPVHYFEPVLGDLAALGLQFVPPHIMRKIGRNPLGRLFLNRHTVEYWNSFGNKMARMIHSADFVGALEEARRARASGNEAKAKELEFLVQMSRAALRDGVLLNMVQFRGMEYNDSDWKALFARYNLDFDEEPIGTRSLRDLPRGAWDRTKRVWNKVGDASEIASMTTKLGVYCYLHRDASPAMGDVTAAESFADPVRRMEAAYRAATLAGDPTFELRGHLMTFIELTSGPFLNARQKGFLRTPAMLMGTGEWLRDDGTFRTEGPGRHTAEATLKMSAHWAKRLYVGALVTGGLSALTLGLYRLLTGNDEATEEDMEGSSLGTLNTFFRWSEGVLRNCSPYTLLNFWAAPVWSEGDVSVVLCTPISDEERVLNLLMDAAMNQAGLPTINPTTGLAEVANEAFTNLMNPVGGQGTLSEYRRILAPWLENQNPFDPFRQRPVLNDEEFAARWSEPNAAKTMAWRAIGASPLSLALKPSDVRNDEIPEGPLKTFHAFVTRTPVLSSVLGGFLRFQIGGETAR